MIRRKTQPNVKSEDISGFQRMASQEKPQKSQFNTYEGQDNMIMAAQPYDPMQARSSCLDSGVKSGALDNGGNYKQDPYVASHKK